MPGRRAPWPRSATTRDVLVATVAFVLTLLLTGRFGDPAKRGLDALGVVLTAVATLPLIGRRQRPLVAFVVTTSASAAMAALGYGLGPPIGPTIALFFVASDARTPQRWSLTAVVVLVMFGLHVGLTTVAHAGFPTDPVAFGTIVWGAAWLIGDQVRQRRARLADLVERARRAEHDLNRERRLAAAEERTRIARDLHDSAAHAINVILVQAGAARLLQEQDPARVRRALSTIEDVARQTINEIDDLVRRLRDGQPASGAGASVEPPAGLAAVSTLQALHRAAGFSVEVHTSGAVTPLPPSVDQAAYRILQEALTNAARYGTGAADVEIGYAGDRLELAVTNLLPPGAPHAHGNHGGHGILGMRERAALLGGTVRAGRQDRQFVVRAALPHRAEAAQR